MTLPALTSVKRTLPDTSCAYGMKMKHSMHAVLQYSRIGQFASQVQPPMGRQLILIQNILLVDVHGFTYRLVGNPRQLKQGEQRI
jgi:hypothetical protein